MNQPSAFGAKKDSYMKHNSSVTAEKVNANGQTHLSLNKKSSFFTDKNTADTNINTMLEEQLSDSNVLVDKQELEENLQRCKSQLELAKIKIYNKNLSINSPDKLSSNKINKCRGDLKGSVILERQNSSATNNGSGRGKCRVICETEMNIKNYARTILEKILLDKTLESPMQSPCNLADQNLSHLLSKIDIKNQNSLRMILLVFYNQYYVVGPEQIDYFNKIDDIDFPQLFSSSKKLKVTIFRKIQKVKTLFKRFLSEKNETEKVNELELLSLKSEYKEFFTKPDNFKLAEEYFQNKNFLTKYHSDLEKNLTNYVNQLYDKIEYYKGSSNLSTFFYRYIIQDQNPFIWSLNEIVTSVEAFLNNCSLKYETNSNFAEINLIYEKDYNFTKKKKRERENQRMLQRKDKIDQERWLGNLFGLSEDIVEVFDKNRTDKREIKEKKAKETLKKNYNAYKKSVRKNSTPKINQTSAEDKFLLHDILYGNQSGAQNKYKQHNCLLEKRNIILNSSEDDNSNTNPLFFSQIIDKKLKVESAKPTPGKSLSTMDTKVSILLKDVVSVTLSEDNESHQQGSSSI